MTDATPQETTAEESNNKPDWTVKTQRGYGRKSHLETVGAAWNREKDGGICIRLIGKQLIENDLYIYPLDKTANGDSA